MEEIFDGIYSLFLAVAVTSVLKMLSGDRAGKALDFLLALFLLVAVALPISGTAELITNLDPGRYSEIRGTLEEKYLGIRDGSTEKLTKEAVASFENELCARICRRFELPDEAVSAEAEMNGGAVTGATVTLGIRAYLADPEEVGKYASDTAGVPVTVKHR